MRNILGFPAMGFTYLRISCHYDVEQHFLPTISDIVINKPLAFANQHFMYKSFALLWSS